MKFCKRHASVAAELQIFENERIIYMIKPDFAKEGGLLPAIAQDYESGKVLMMAFMNEEAWLETCRTRRAVYFSRSRQKLWRKGEESGNVQEVKEIYLDCDLDCILLKVNQIGHVACHTGHESCFYRKVDENGELVEVEAVLKDPAQMYGGKK